MGVVKGAISIKDNMTDVRFPCSCGHLLDYGGLAFLPLCQYNVGKGGLCSVQAKVVLFRQKVIKNDGFPSLCLLLGNREIPQTFL